MELNPKLLQYSLDIQTSQSKIIKSNHNHHLKKLHQIKNKSNTLKVKQNTQSLKNITQSIHKYHQYSRDFKTKQFQQKKCSQDLKMIRSLSQIHHHRQMQQKTHQQVNKTLQQYKQRNQSHKRLITILKNKQLQQRNLKIAIRISRQQNDFSYVQKIKNEIKEYSKIRKNLQKIKEQPTIKSRTKTNYNKKYYPKLKTEGRESFMDQYQEKQQGNLIRMNLKTDKNEENSEQQFLYEVLKKHPSQILTQKFFNLISHENKDKIMLPKLP